MARPNQTDEKRRKLLPIVAKAFAELGYRRTTTAELGRRCGVRENILYRLWADKKRMFISAIEFVFDQSLEIWQGILTAQANGRSAAQRLLDYESTHHGEFGYYRIVFAGWSEVDDPDIRAALVNMYARYHRFIENQIASHREAAAAGDTPSPILAAWALLGLGTMANIGRELGVLSEQQRKQLFSEVGGLLLDGHAGEKTQT